MVLPTLCTINNLIWDNKVPWSNLLLQASHCTECNDRPDPNASQSCNVRSRGNFVRCNLVVHAMSRQERDRNLVVLKDVDRCRRVAPWSQRIDCCNWYVTFELLETSTADHGNANGACKGISTRFYKRIRSSYDRKRLAGLPSRGNGCGRA